MSLKFILLLSLLSLFFTTSLALPYHDYSVSDESIEKTEPSASPSTNHSLCTENKGLLDPVSLYDHKTARCYPVGSQGPCPKYELWWQQTKEYGMCGCIFQESYCNGKFNSPIARSKKDQTCYPLYEQGICGENEWFTVNKNWEGICATNPCLGLTVSEVSPKKLIDVLMYMSMNGETPEWVLNDAPKGVYPREINKPIWYLHEGKCYRTFTQGHCAHMNETALFSGTNPTPDCNVIHYNDEGEPYSRTCQAAGALASALPPCPQGFLRHGADCKPNNYQGVEIEEE